MTSIKSLIVLTLILTISFGQEIRFEAPPDNIPVQRSSVRQVKVGPEITHVVRPAPVTLEKKITLPLNELMDRKQECPRLQDLGSKLLNDPNFCDIEIEVHDQRINESRVFCAHRAILCLRSEVLNKRIEELMKTHSGPRKPRLRLYGFNPDIFHYILQYIYTDKIDPNFDLRRNIMDLYVAADYVQLPELNAMIKEYLYDSVNTNDVSRYIQWANKYGHRHLKYFLLDITRTALKMNRNEWRQFITNMCDSHKDGGPEDFETLILREVRPIVKKLEVPESSFRG